MGDTALVLSRYRLVGVGVVTVTNVVIRGGACVDAGAGGGTATLMKGNGTGSLSKPSLAF